MVWAGLISSSVSCHNPTWLAWLKRIWTFEFLWHINWVSAAGRRVRKQQQCLFMKRSRFEIPFNGLVWTLTARTTDRTTGGYGHQMYGSEKEKERMPLKFLFKCNQTKLEIANINVCSPNEEGAQWSDQNEMRMWVSVVGRTAGNFSRCRCHV